MQDGVKDMDTDTFLQGFTRFSFSIRKDGVAIQKTTRQEGQETSGQRL